MKKRLVFFILALFSLGLAAERAWAWGNTWPGIALEQAYQAARWRAGLLRGYAALTLDNAGYDSDIYYGYLAEKTPDYTFGVGPMVRLMLPVSRKLVFDVSGFPQYLFYFKTDKERTFNYRFNGQAHFVFDRVYMSAGGGLSNMKMRLSPELNVNVRIKEDSLNGLLFGQLAKGSAVALQYSGAWLDYGDAAYGTIPLAVTLNRNEHRLDLLGYFQRTPGTRFFLAGQFGYYRFSSPLSRFKDTRSYAVYGGVEFIPRTGVEFRSPRVHGRFNLGYAYFDVIEPGRRDGMGLTGNTDVTVDLDPKTSFRAFFSRGFQFSAYSDLAFYNMTSYGGGLTRLLSRHASVDYTLAFGRSTYPEGDGGIPSAGREMKYTAHSLRLSLQLARALRASLFGTLGRRTRLEVEPAVNRYFVGCSLMYGYSGGEAAAPTGIMF
jgi:hypothetical protein